MMVKPESAGSSPPAHEGPAVGRARSRLLAWVLDIVIEAAIVGGVAVAALIPARLVANASGDGGLQDTVIAMAFWFVITLGGLAVWWIVLFVMVARSGQTPGKRVVGLRIVNRDGAALGWGRAFVRFTAGRSAIAIPGVAFLLAEGSVEVLFLVGALVVTALYACILFDGARRGLADRLVGSFVVQARDADG